MFSLPASFAFIFSWLRRRLFSYSILKGFEKQNWIKCLKISGGEEMEPREFNLPLFDSEDSLYTQPLQKAFANTTASYKFLWFLAILDLVKESAPTSFQSLTISTQDICIRMVAKAWIPTQRFKLSFGRFDSITKIINALKIEPDFPFSPHYKENDAVRVLEAFAQNYPKKFKKNHLFYFDEIRASMFS